MQGANGLEVLSHAQEDFFYWIAMVKPTTVLVTVRRTIATKEELYPRSPFTPLLALQGLGCIHSNTILTCLHSTSRTMHFACYHGLLFSDLQSESSCVFRQRRTKDIEQARSRKAYGWATRRKQTIENHSKAMWGYTAY